MNAARIVESNKKPGVRYVFTDDGVELPIVDITHPAFALSVSEAEQKALVDRFLSEEQPLDKLPAPLRKLALRVFLRGSTLARGIRGAEDGGFLDGMSTYLLKLGPDNLGSGYTKPIDRRIAAALPSMAVRLRLQDVARLLADALAPVLEAQPRRPLHLLNVAGGPAMDTLNALVLLNQEHPLALADRPILINVLDLDSAGPAFGRRALAAYLAEGAPLQGRAISFQHTRYDWSNATQLDDVLGAARRDRALIAASSEGGLFEYGSDDQIVANLKRLHPAVVVTGSVTRADEPIQRLRQTSQPGTRPRGLDLFRPLATRAGWTIGRAIERPFSDQIALVAS